MAESFRMDQIQLLHFFFQLSCMELGKSYCLDALTETQQRLLSDLRDLGKFPRYE